MNKIEAIQKVLNTLNTIPVAGTEFQDRMVNCVRILASVKIELKNEAEEKEATANDENCEN